MSGDPYDDARTDRFDAAPDRPSKAAAHRRGRWRALFVAIVALALVVVTVGVLFPPNG